MLAVVMGGEGSDVGWRVVDPVYVRHWEEVPQKRGSFSACCVIHWVVRTLARGV